MSGILYIIATPIGNRKDITVRAMEILKKVSFTVAEDTRRTGSLLKHYEIEKKPFISCHRFNERRKTEKIFEILTNGSDIALVSDSGTPAISDPGAYVIKKVHEKGFTIIPIPGPSALVAAFCVSGIEKGEFIFIGFPGKKPKDIKRIKDLMEKTGLALIFYESPKRILKTLNALRDLMPDITVTLCRELTKSHEEIIRGSIEEVIAAVEKKHSVKGECVVVIENIEIPKKEKKRKEINHETPRKGTQR